MKSSKVKYTQIIISSLGMVCLIFIMALFWFEGIVESSAREEFENNTKSKLQVIDSISKIRFEKIYEDIEMFAKHDLIILDKGKITTYYQNKDRVLMKPMEGSEREKAIFRMFQQYGESHEGVEYIYFATQDGGYVVWPQTYITANYDPRIRPWYVRGLAASNRVLQTEPYEDLVTNKKILSNVKLATSLDRDRIGILGIDINLKSLSNILEGTKILKYEHYILVHSSGIILEDTMYPKNNMRYMSEEYENIINEDFEYGETYVTKINDKEVFLMKNKIEDLNWDVYSVSNKRILLNQYKELRSNYFMGAIFVAFAVSGVLLVGVYMMLKSRRLYKQHMYNLRYFDSLTKLRNKTLFDKDAIDVISRYPQDVKHALIIINIDNFRIVNEAKGYEFGNKILIAIAENLKNMLGEDEILARIGSDEFAILKPNIESYESVYNFIVSLDKGINRMYSISGDEIFVNLNMGISMYPNDALNYANLLKNAISALNSSKNNSGNSFEFYNQEINTKSIYKYEIKNKLKNAINEREFRLHYQPQVDTKSNKIIGLEALIRWETDRGFIPPNMFIPIAEEANLIIAIGEWVLLNACQFGHRLNELGYNVPLAINISRLQFKYPYINILVNSILEKTGFSPNMLELEITESILMGNNEECATILEDFKRMGIKVAIDDFGTGYSSLSYLKKFNVDKIKIDRSFVKDIPENDDGTIAKVIIDLANILNMEVIAEGVENLNQIKFLKENRCSQVQGYFYSKPLSEDDIIEFIKGFNN